MLHEFLHNFEHNLFKPLLLFFYFGFLLPLLKVDFEFPYVIYQGLTMYLLLAIGWHGGEELAAINASSIAHIAGFMVIGFLLNFLIGFLAYLLLSRLTALRRVDKATVAGYYGSDSAGTFATCVAILVECGVGVRRLYAGDARRDGGSGLSGGAVPGRAAAAQGNGRRRQHAR